MNALIAYSVNKGTAVSVLSFTSSITTSSASSVGHNRDALDNDTVLCGLSDGTIKFVKVCEVQEGGIAKKVATKKKLAENEESNIGEQVACFALVLSSGSLCTRKRAWLYQLFAHVSNYL